MDDENEDEEGEDSHSYRVNEKVRDLTKAKGKCATGAAACSKHESLLELRSPRCRINAPVTLLGVFMTSLWRSSEVKYDDGSTRSGVPFKQLRPLEQAESDGTGLSYTASLNVSWPSGTVFIIGSPRG